jgi:hypothetical protein
VREEAMAHGGLPRQKQKKKPGGYQPTNKVQVVIIEL